MKMKNDEDDEEDLNGASNVSKSRVSQENTDGDGICHKSGKPTQSLAANESNETGKSSKLGEQRDGKLSFSNSVSDMGVYGCCVVPSSSLRPLFEVAIRPSRAQLDRRQAWRAFVKSAQTIYEMIQATITLEDMIKTEFLRNDWWYWSSFSAAAKSSTLPSLALRIYSLDSAIMYEKMHNSSLTDSSDPPAVAE
ncbi:unnamed protein product [Vicia faba]|uniref:Uncharacterized protein n=1 Tax=Vicia faba TaxID=3906 RepID=A0AAV0Z253_VICFA|nr:unnamed protein product [Vicia faba]